MNIELARHRQRIDALFDKARELPQEPELLAHWARYLCILVSGFVELAMSHLYGSYAQRKSHPNVARYVQQRLRRPANHNAERVVQLATAFNKDWGHELGLYLAGQRKDALDSLMNNRNQIAHGQPVGLTLSGLRTYYASAVDVVEWVQTKCC